MRFEPGKSGNPKGRPKGSKNVSSEAIRATFAAFLSRNMERLQTDFDALKSPEKRLNYLERIARLILPPPLPIWERMTEEQFQEFLNEIKENRAEPQ
jgi:hypothetical protein